MRTGRCRRSTYTTTTKHIPGRVCGPSLAPGARSCIRWSPCSAAKQNEITGEHRLGFGFSHLERGEQSSLRGKGFGFVDSVFFFRSPFVLSYTFSPLRPSKPSDPCSDARTLPTLFFPEARAAAGARGTDQHGERGTPCERGVQDGAAARERGSGTMIARSIAVWVLLGCPLAAGATAGAADRVVRARAGAAGRLAAGSLTTLSSTANLPAFGMVPRSLPPLTHPSVCGMGTAWRRSTFARS